MRRALLALVSALLLTGLLAFAESPLPQFRVSVTAEPSGMSVPSACILSFELQNRTGEQLENLCLTTTEGQLLSELGNLAPGDSLTFDQNWSVDQQALDAGRVELVVTCVQDSDHYTIPVSAAIEKQPIAPQVEFLRRLSARQADRDGRITLVYDVRNTGNVDIQTIVINDSIEAANETIDLLPIGQSHTAIHPLTIEDDVVSSPVLTYSTTSDPATIYTVKLDPLTIERGYGSLEAELVLEHSLTSPNVGEVTLQLRASGNMDYRRIQVRDDVLGGIIAEGLSLCAGDDPIRIERTLLLNAADACRWRISCVNSAGEKQELVTNSINLSESRIEPRTLLSLSAETAMPRISAPGEIKVSLTLDNSGSAPASNVVVFEEAAGEVQRLALVPTGEPMTCELQCDIRENQTLRYFVQYDDVDGAQHIVRAEPIEVTIARDGVAPLGQEAVTLLFRGTSIQISHPMLMTALLIAACAIFVVLLVILLVTSRKARFRRKVRDEARRQQRMRQMQASAPRREKKARRDRKSKPNK